MGISKCGNVMYLCDVEGGGNKGEEVLDRPTNLRAMAEGTIQKICTLELQ